MSNEQVVKKMYPSAYAEKFTMSGPLAKSYYLIWDKRGLYQRRLAEGETKFQAIHKFYTNTIRTALGLRGYNFQLKVDQAESLDDLRVLHEPYIAAVLKAKGDAVARELHLHLEQLFNLEDLSTEAK